MEEQANKCRVTHGAETAETHRASIQIERNSLKVMTQEDIDKAAYNRRD